jgi:four helix bundle protein
MNYYGKAPELVTRTRSYALRVIQFYSELPRTPVAQILGKQLLRSATSVGAQYREAQQAKSIADFVSKSEGALQELEESAYWLELFEASGTASGPGVEDLYSETLQLVSIFVSVVRAAKRTRAQT